MKNKRENAGVGQERERLLREISGALKTPMAVLAVIWRVIFAGGAGMLFFEGNLTGELSGYGARVWWTAMVVTTMGSEYWPKSAEGRRDPILTKNGSDPIIRQQ